MILINLALFFVYASILIVSGSYMVKYLTRIANYLKINEFIISFVLIAFSTSIPELFVGITSALSGSPSLSLGNVIGANIANLTIVIGIPILLARGINVDTVTARRDVTYMFIISSLPLVLMSIGNELSRIDGVILVGVFGFYIYKLMIQQRVFHKVVAERFTRQGILKDVGFFFISITFLFFSARLVVKYATFLSIDLELPAIMIGLLLLALGTSLPELTFNIRAVIQKHPEMALGDTVGSVVTNSTLVLGVVAIIHPIQAAISIFLTSWIFMLVVGFLFMTFVEGNYKLSWREGVALIMMYSLFILIEFYVKSIF